jgi:hypothetical protein
VELWKEILRLFVLGDAVSNWDKKCGMTGIMNWEWCGKKRSWPNFRSYCDICLEGLRKNHSERNRTTCLRAKT